jgi:hypothetical protein
MGDTAPARRWTGQRRACAAGSYEVTPSDRLVSGECPSQADESTSGQSERTSAGFDGVRPGSGTHPHADQLSLRSGGPSAGYLNPRCRLTFTTGDRTEPDRRTRQGAASRSVAWPSGDGAKRNPSVLPEGHAASDQVGVASVTTVPAAAGPGDGLIPLTVGRAPEAGDAVSSYTTALPSGRFRGRKAKTAPPGRLRAPRPTIVPWSGDSSLRPSPLPPAPAVVTAIAAYTPVTGSRGTPAPVGWAGRRRTGRHWPSTATPPH